MRETSGMEARFLALLESAPDSIVITDAAGRIVMVNSQTEQIFGYRRDELLGGQIEILMPARFRGLHSHHRQGYAHHPRTRPMGNGLNLIGLRKDGHEFPVEISLSPLTTDEGLLITSIIRDISERKNAEHALKQAYDEMEQRVEARTAELKRANDILREQAALLDKTQDAIIVRQLDSTITLWNRSAERIYGWRADEVLGKSANQLIYKNPANPLVAEACETTLKHGEWHGDLHQITRVGKEIVVESNWTLMRDDQGRPRSFLVVNTDITEKKKLAAQFLRAQRMESIGTLASGIAHDLNNAFTPILLSIEMLQEQIIDDEQRFLLNSIGAAAERGSYMVRQVISFARGVEGERVPLQPRHLVSEIEKIMRQTFPKQIELDTHVAKDLGNVSGDATQLFQVLMNLAVNARDAMPQGGKLTIKAENAVIDNEFARVHIEAQPGHYVVITISDSGCGIPAEIVDKIFEPFFTTKEIGKGTGLGLSTSLGIVKSHGGFIDVYSEVGVGTAFKVYLPVADSNGYEEELIISNARAGNGELILVVDDEPEICEITRSTLVHRGYQVVTAGDGTEALAIYAKYLDEVKLVIMDMMMPYLDGPATIRAIEKLNKGVKIIATSGLPNHTRGMLPSNVKAFLPKPYHAGTLLELVAEVLTTETERF